jgi:hypothetical protein
MFSAARAEWVKTEWVNGFIGVMAVGLTVLFVRSGFGLVFGIMVGMGLMVVAKQTGAGVNRALLLTLGLTSALYAILDIKSDVLDRPEIQSDARMLAEITGIPTIVWGVIWIAVAVGFSAWLMRRAYKDA